MKIEDYHFKRKRTLSPNNMFHNLTSQVSVTATKNAPINIIKNMKRKKKNQFTNVIIVPNVNNMKIGEEADRTEDSLDSNEIQIKAKGFEAFENSTFHECEKSNRIAISVN